MTAPHRTEPCTFQGPAGRIEGLLDFPAAALVAVAVICHPHPLQGGAMHNKVAYILARAFNDLGALSLRFNFRGVGASEGSFDAGRGETEDALAAIDWLAAGNPGLPLWLAGFSFGAYVALRTQSQRPVARLVTVAPAVERFEAASVIDPVCPWLLVQGDADEVVAPQGVLDWAAGRAHPPRIAVLPGAGHFFHGRLNDLRDIVIQSFAVIPKSS
ncbi:MAG TPA: alpha/beta fold hydrolase [Gammaproteobacteria bacterium]|nr:alpha/beta fold hydrolase [Gammaproteobacteria bacterium]